LSTLMNWTSSNNCHWICSTDFSEGTQDQTGGFRALLFAGFWGFSEVYISDFKY